MPLSRQGLAKLLRSGEILYLFLVVLSFCLLLLSRTGEAYTVWEVLHPAFIPVLFAATALLVAILLTSEKVTYKLLFIIGYSVLVHSFFSIVFPAGDSSGQQMALGRTRLVYDNAVLHGWPSWTTEAFQSQIYALFNGINFLAALSVVFARMVSIDLLWVHLFLVPVLWGVFTPIAAYLTTGTLTQNDKVAALAGLLFSAFPYSTYFGAISVPNSLGFIFFFYSLYFMLKNLESSDSKTTILMLAFSFLAFLSHYLTGIMSFSLLLLALAFKSYRGEKHAAPITTKVSLTMSFFFCTSLLPLSLIYLRLFRPNTNTVFTLDKFHEWPIEIIVGIFLLGDPRTYGFDANIILLMIIGPVIALLCIVYLLYRSKRDRDAQLQTSMLFLSMAFLMMLVDYTILKLFMDELPLNEERLWVLRDFVAVPFVALAIYAVILSLKAFLKARYSLALSISGSKTVREGSRPQQKNISLRGLGLSLRVLFFSLTVFFPLLLAGWMTTSLSAAYPQVAPYLQTTSYELEAVKYIEEKTNEKYVVICDVWTVYAGERIVGVYNPRAYYFAEYDTTGYELFDNMKSEPSPQWMLLAMNYTKTTVAYFIIVEPRLGTDEFNKVASLALKNEQLKLVEVFGDGKLYVFSYRKE